MTTEMKSNEDVAVMCGLKGAVLATYLKLYVLRCADGTLAGNDSTGKRREICGLLIQYKQ